MGCSFQNADYFRLSGRFGEPSISIYSPMESSAARQRQNPIRFRNLVKAVETRLKADYPKEVEYFVDTLRELDTPAFWNTPSRGLAVFLSQDLFESHRLAFSVPELVVVSDTFHTRPLLEYVGTVSSYYVLAVSQDHVVLYDGWREFLRPLVTPGLPRHMKDVVGEFEKGSQRHSHSVSRGGAQSVYHTSGEGARDVERDLEVFFRTIDTEVRRLVNRSGRPVVLVAQPHNQSIYRKVSRLPSLISGGIPCEAKTLSPMDIGKRAWPLVESWAHDRLRILLEACHRAKSRGRGSDELRDVARKAVQGRVKLLLLGTTAPVWGRLDRTTGEIEVAEGGPGAVDILDELAELVLSRGGDVRIWEGRPFPVPTGLAAVYSYT